MTKRRDELHSFVRSLNVEERRHVLNILTSLNDLTFALPTELVLQIFNHLPLLSTWTLQRVSRRWRAVLSSEDFIRSAVLRWQTHDDTDSARSPEEVSASELTGRVQHLKALCTGQAFHEITVEQGCSLLGGLACISLKGCRLAYVLRRFSGSLERDAVIVRNLISGERRKLQGVARESVMHVQLTTSLTAWTTFDGAMYVLYHDKPPSEMDRVQLPSSSIGAFAADGEAIALMMRPSQPDTGYACELILYEARSRRLQSFNLLSELTSFDSLHRAASWFLMVESERRLIHVLAIKRTVQQAAHRPDHHYKEIGHVTLSFTGEWLRAVALPLRIDMPRWVHNYRLSLKYCRPTGYKDEYSLIACAVNAQNLGPAAQYTLHFNIRLGRHIGQESSPWLNTQNLGYLPFPECIWKGQRHRPSPPDELQTLECVMNDTFLVIMEADKTQVCDSGDLIRVLCFDPGVKMATSPEGEEVVF